MPNPQYVSDADVISDDWFDNGFCGWVEYNPPTSWALGQMPLTLGVDGLYGAYALRLTTANVANTSSAGTCSAMKRMTHRAQSGATDKGIVKAEYWFTYGSDGTSAASTWTVAAATYAQVNSVWYVTLTMSGTALQYITVGTWVIVGGVGGITAANASAIVSAVDTNASTITYPVASAPSGTYTSGGTVQFKRDLAAPRSISFQVDSQTNVDGTSSKARTAGQRTHWIAAWLNSDQSGGAPYPSGQWLISQGSGLTFGAPGYASPDNTGLCYTGYYSDFCQNQNLRNLMYVAMIMDTRTGNWLGLQANDQYMDLTQIPSLGGQSAPPVLSTLDPSYNLTDFNGGLNQYMQINNLTTGGVGTSYATAAWLEMHRTRMSYQ